MQAVTKPIKKGSFSQKWKRDMKLNWSLYLLALPIAAYYIIFKYAPMYGVLIAFKDYSPSAGIIGSPWTSHNGFGHFIDYFGSMYFVRTLRNTFLLSLYSTIWGFPMPIILALLFNELRSNKYKRVVQTISYLPHFISTVVICGIIRQFCKSDGLFNIIRSYFDLPGISLLQNIKYFRTVFISSGIWQGVGWGSIIYLAAITGVDPQLYEAAALDGAGRFKRILHVTLPGMSGTISLLFIMSMSGLLSAGGEKILLLYNEATYEVSDVISSYVYRRGLLRGDMSFSTAVGLLNQVVGIILVLTANKVARQVADVGLF